MRNRLLWSGFGLLIGLGLLLSVGTRSAEGFAEEELGFRDTDGTTYAPSGQFPANRISTFHDDLTLTLALAAGFTVPDSQRLRIWDQLVDSEILPGMSGGYSYDNAGFPAPPLANLACEGKESGHQIWPTADFDPETAAVTSRFGPFSPFFHFPHLNGADLQALRAWGWGQSSTLEGYAAYAWGRRSDLTLVKATQNNGCVITHTVTISMPVAAGSLEAFATYLHSLGDAYSHADCLAELAATAPEAPWGTHTLPILGDPSVYACDYNPSNPQNDDPHGREFGSVYTDTARTIAAAEAIYDELAARSRTYEGLYQPLSLSSTLTVNGTSITLDGAIRQALSGWNYDQPEERRAYLDQLAAAIQAQPRTHIRRVVLPVVLR